MPPIAPIQKIPAILHTTSGVLATWLERALPKLVEEDWWDSLVVNRLSNAQSKRIRDKEVTTLSQLDLAALLRVLSDTS